MTHLETAILRVLGPLSNAAIDRHLHESPDRTYRVLKGLVSRGLAAHPKLQRYDITRLGREHFAKRPWSGLTLFQE